MKKNKFTSVLMAILLVIQALAFSVGAEEQPLRTITGSLLLTGNAYVGGMLSADLSKAEPEGLTADDVTCRWSAMDKDKGESVLLSEEKSYTPVTEDLGRQIELTVTGREDKGFTGSLTVKTAPVAATEEEAIALKEQAGNFTGTDADTGDGSMQYAADGTAGQSAETGEYYDAAGQPGEAYEGYGAPDQPVEAYEGYGEADEPGEAAVFYGEADKPGETSGYYDAETGNYYDASDQNADVYSAGWGQDDTQENTGWGQDDTQDEEESVDYGEQFEIPSDQFSSNENEDAGNPVSGMENVTEEFYVYDPVTGEEISQTIPPQETAVQDTETQDAEENTSEDGTAAWEGSDSVEWALKPSEEGSDVGSPAESEDEGSAAGEESQENESTGEGASAVALTFEGKNEIDFGTVGALSLEDPEVQYFTITNTGTEPLNFEENMPEHFMVGDVMDTLEPGDSATLFIEPRTTVEPGEYRDEITYHSLEGAEASITAVIKVEGEEPEADADIIPEADPAAEPEADPFTEPEADSFTEPEADPVAEPETDPDTDPSITPEADPTTEPETTPEADPDTDPVTTPEADPTTDPETTPEADPETTPEPAQYTAGLSTSPNGLEFGEAEEGYETLPEAQAVTLTNIGELPISITLPESGGFTYEIPENTIIAPEEQLVLYYQPAAGLAAGDYDITIPFEYEAVPPEDYDPEKDQITYPDGAGNSVRLHFTVSAKEEVVYNISLDKYSVDFGSIEAGYAAPPAGQTVIVTNTGNAAVTLLQPTGVTYSVGNLSAAELAPGEKSTFTITPKKGLSQGQYFETITVRGSGNVSASLNANFIVSAKTISLTGIINPTAVTGVPNGSLKSAAGLQLPGAVVITTTSDNMSAAVTWDTASCSYDPSLKTEQTFTVNGRVTLPSGIQNPDNIALVTAVRVTVSGRSPIVPDTSGNQIAGIANGQVFTTDEKICFSAIGAGCDNIAPVVGDIRYVPSCWYVVENRQWTCEPYTATFRIGVAGSHVLSVTYVQQQYNGSTWVNTGGQDVKSLNFTVQGGKTVTMTPVPGQRNNPRTGDDNNLVLVSLLFAAAAAAVVLLIILLIRRRRK